MIANATSPPSVLRESKLFLRFEKIGRARHVPAPRLLVYVAGPATLPRTANSTRRLRCVGLPVLSCRQAHKTLTLPRISGQSSRIPV